MTNSQHLTTISEFMGWEIEKNKGVYFFVIARSERGVAEVKRILSFDTMRMVFDKWREECKHLTDCDFRKYVELLQNIERALCSGTPTDCALRLAEAIEWWKTVK